MHEHLTTRQVEILRLMADGLTAEQIGVELKLKHRTITGHQRMMRAKLDASNGCQLIDRGHKLGYLGGGAK